jgi:hypothetical protein
MPVTAVLLQLTILSIKEHTIALDVIVAQEKIEK